MTQPIAMADGDGTGRKRHRAESDDDDAEWRPPVKSASGGDHGDLDDENELSADLNEGKAAFLARVHAAADPLLQAIDAAVARDGARFFSNDENHMQNCVHFYFYFENLEF